MRDIDKTKAADDVIEACIANQMGLHGRVRGLQLATEEHGLRAVIVWQRMQLIHETDLEDPEPTACGSLQGTTSGASRHYRAKERLCDPCRTAANIANRARRPRKHAEQKHGPQPADQVRVDRWLAGETGLRLNNREKREVIRARLRQGWTSAEIACDLGVRTDTVHTAVRRHRLRDGISRPEAQLRLDRIGRRGTA